MAEAIGEMLAVDNQYPDRLTIRASAYSDEFATLFIKGREHSAFIDLVPSEAERLGEFLLRFAR